MQTKDVLEKIKGTVARVVPSFKTYEVWSTASIEIPGPTQLVGDLVWLGYDDLERIEQERPGYGAVARDYLDAEHVGLGVVRDGRLAATSWMAINRSPEVLRVKGHFDLAPGEAFLHADWVSPEHRRQGLHTALITGRVAASLSLLGDSARAVATIAKSNDASWRSYEKLGFTREGSVAVARLRHRRAARRTWTNEE